MGELGFYPFPDIGVISGGGRDARLHRSKDQLGLKVAQCSSTLRVVSPETFPYLYIALCHRCWKRPYEYARVDEGGAFLFDIEQLALAYDRADV